jgi:hypothetical protein
MCRVHKWGMVEAAMRLVVRCQLSSSATNASSRCEVSRETGVSASARARSTRGREGIRDPGDHVHAAPHDHDVGYWLSRDRALCIQVDYSGVRAVSGRARGPPPCRRA